MYWPEEDCTTVLYISSVVDPSPLMNEQSEKETASQAHEHSKGKVTRQFTANILNASQLLVRIQSFTKRAYFGHGHTYDAYWYGLPTGTGTGV